MSDPVVVPDVPPVATPDIPAVPDVPSVAAPAGWDGKVESLDAGVQKMISDLRKEAGDNRVAKNAEQDRVKAILAAAGISDESDDPVEAAKTASAERDTATASAKSSARELAIYKAAATNGADATKLMDSNSFITSIAGIDPGDGDAIATAIRAAVEANTNLKAVRAAGASGIELGGTQEQGQVSEAQLAQMTPEQIVDAQNRGLLKNLL